MLDTIKEDKTFERQSFVRWAVQAPRRILYRWWTRVAARFFPEGSAAATFLEKIGIPLPDQLNMSWITSHLAVGGRIRPEDISRLPDQRVTCVVDVRSEYSDDPEALKKVGVELLYLPTPDTDPLSIEDLYKGADWINAQIDNGESVLVHCEHGIGRSVMLTCAALMLQGSSLQDALALIQKKRWQAAPNSRQIERLQEFAAKLKTV